MVGILWQTNKFKTHILLLHDTPQIKLPLMLCHENQRKSQWEFNFRYVKICFLIINKGKNNNLTEF